MRVLFTALWFAATIVTPAHATHYRHHHHHSVSRQYVAQAQPSGDPRPAAWCGWEMRQWLGVLDKAYNLAANWAHYGRDAGGPHVGAVIVYAHHVGEIVAGSCPAGQIMLHSGNDGNAVRTRCFPTRGAIAFRYPPGRFGA